MHSVSPMPPPSQQPRGCRDWWCPQDMAETSANATKFMKFSWASESSISLEMHSASSLVQDLHRLSISSLKEVRQRHLHQSLFHQTWPSFKIVSPDLSCKLKSRPSQLPPTNWHELKIVHFFFPTVSRPWFSILAAACLATMSLQANYNGFKHTTLTRLWPQTSNFK